MTVVAIASVKGAPGATTASCLLAANWPSHRRVVLVEADPSGGDLAARFQLSTRRGMSSFAAASRRLEGVETIDAHVQRLPGGLEVLVGTAPTDAIDDRRAATAVLSSARLDRQGTRDVIVDVGRLLPGELRVGPWLERSTVVLIVLCREAASILHTRDRVPALRSYGPGRLGLVLIGDGPFGRKEIERFIGLPTLAELPYEPAAAQIVGGRPGGVPRLSRSRLVSSSWRLARALGRDSATTAEPTAGESESSEAATDSGELEAGVVKADEPVLAFRFAKRLRSGNRRAEQHEVEGHATDQHEAEGHATDQHEVEGHATDQHEVFL